jgi:hypothetical protein
MRLLNLREIEEKYGTNPLASYNIHKSFPQFENFIMHPYTPGYKQTKLNKMLQEPKYFVGSSFWDDFADGFKKGFTTTLDLGSHLLPLVGLGREEHHSDAESDSEAEEEAHEKVHKAHELQENKKLKKVKKLADSMLASNRRMLRAELIRKIMKDRKVNMITASQIIKSEKLKY